MEFKGTKGEWFVKGRVNLSVSSNVDILQYPICKIDNFDKSLKSSTANAKLIAAAPELLELCLLVHGSFGGGNVITFSEKDISDFNNAINKALN